MSTGEVSVVVALIVFAAGTLVVVFADAPLSAVSTAEEGRTVEGLSVYESLKQSIRPYHFGNVPMEMFSADTTVLRVDMDYYRYTLPQVDLYVTRILRELGFAGIVVAQRAEGGLLFYADFPNGQPLQIRFVSYR